MIMTQAEPMDDESPEAAEDMPEEADTETAEPEAEAPEAPAATPAALAAAPEAAATPEEPDQEEGAAPAAEAPAAAPASGAAAVKKELNQTPAAPNNEIEVPGSDGIRQAKLFEQDMAQGHIKPKTMQDLYAERDTPGKIGMLFGLLVAGMGSGLTGQPNAVLEMMNKQISNDLEAQKTTNSNAQNWYKLNLEHQLQKAQIPGVQAETEVKKATGDKIKMEAEIDASVAAKNYMKLNEWGTLKEQGEKIPPGPLRDKYDAALGHLKNQIDQSIITDTAQAEQKKKLINAATGGNKAQEAAPYATVDTEDLRRLNGVYKRNVQMEGPAANKNGVQKGVSDQDYADAKPEAALVNKNRAGYHTLTNAFVDLSSRFATGALDKGSYDTYKSHVAGQLKQAGYPQDEAKNLVESTLPSWKDRFSLTGDTRQVKASQMRELFMNAEAGTPTLDALKKKPAFPPPPQFRQGPKKGAPPSASAPAATPAAAPQEMKSKSGKPMIMKNGKWIYK